MTSITIVIAMKKLPQQAENMVFNVKDEVFEWFKSEEGMIFVASLGKLFGAGAMQAIKMPKSSGSLKIFGYKVPQQVVDAIISKFIPGAGQ